MVRAASVLLAFAVLAGCAHEHARNPMAEWVPSPNHDVRDPVIVPQRPGPACHARSKSSTSW